MHIYEVLIITERYEIVKVDRERGRVCKGFILISKHTHGSHILNTPTHMCVMSYVLYVYVCTSTEQ